MIGNLKVGDQIRQTHIRFRNISDYEAYINSIDQDYDSEDAIFNGYIYKNETKQFNKVNMGMVVILIKYSLNIVEIIALYLQKDIVLLKVLIF